MHKKLLRKISTVIEVMKFIYGKYPVSAISRDALGIGVTIAQLVSVTMSGKFLDATAKIFDSWTSFDIKTYIATDSFYYLVLILLLWMIAQIGTQLRDYFYTRIYEQSWMDANQVLIREVADSNLQDVESKDFQDLITYVPAYAIDNMILSYSAISFIIGYTIRMISSLAIIFKTLSWITLTLLVMVLPEVLFSYRRRREIRKYAQKSVKNLKFINYLKSLALRIQVFPEMRVDGTFKYLKDTYRDEYREYLDGLLDGNEEFFADKTLWSLIDQVVKYAFLIYLLAKSIIEKLTLGTFWSLYGYVEVAYDAVFQVLDYSAILSDRLSYAENFFDLAKYEGFGEISHGKKKLEKGTPSLEFQELDFSYPDEPDVKVLEDVSFKINPGEKVAFFGGDGSGKSSLVNILCGLYQIIAGDYSINGKSIRELDRGELKRKIAVVFQNFADYNFTIKENITISDKRKKIDEDLYNKVVKISGVDDVIKKEKINSKQILGKYFEGGREISPGFWQRIAIARMLYRNAKVFIMDEPFSYVDGPSRERILDGILSFAGKDRTVIYVTKDTDNLDKFDRIFFLQNGKIIETGTWKELKKKGSRLYGEIKYNR